MIINFKDKFIFCLIKFYNLKFENKLKVVLM